MFHANGWGFVWTITAVGGAHVCIRKPDPVQVLETVKRERITMLCAAPTVLIGLANAPIEARRASVARRARDDRRRAARGRHHRSGGRWPRVDGDPGLRADRDVSVHHDLRAAARAQPRRRRARGDQGQAGRRAGDVGRAEGRRRRWHGRPERRPDPGRDRRPRQRRDGRLLRQSRGHGARDGRAAGSTRATRPSSIPTATRRFAIG